MVEIIIIKNYIISLVYQGLLPQTSAKTRVASPVCVPGHWWCYRGEAEEAVSWDAGLIHALSPQDVPISKLIKAQDVPRAGLAAQVDMQGNYLLRETFSPACQVAPHEQGFGADLEGARKKNVCGFFPLLFSGYRFRICVIKAKEGRREWENWKGSKKGRMQNEPSDCTCSTDLQAETQNQFRWKNLWNHCVQPNSTMPTHPWTCPVFPKTLPGMVTPLSRQPIPKSNHLLCHDILPNVQPSAT